MSHPTVEEIEAYEKGKLRINRIIKSGGSYAKNEENAKNNEHEKEL